LNSSKARRSGSAYAVGAASLLVMGLGQLLNRQRLKALIWFVLPLIFLGVEWSTSQWGRYLDLRAGRVPAATSSAEEDLYSSPAPAATSSAEEDLYSSPAPTAPPPQKDTIAKDYGLIPSPASPGPGNLGASYFAQTYRYPNYALDPKGRRFLFRDFGGFFTKGIWGLVTLGSLVIDEDYAGAKIELFNKVSPWLSADNSVVRIGEGLIALAALLLLLALWMMGIADAVATRRRLEETGKVEGFHAWVSRIWQSLFAYIVSAPAFLAILFFTIIPFVFTFLLAFTNYNYRVKLGLHLIDWVGFDTFRFLVVDPGWLLIFGQIFLWTLFWAFMSSFTVYALGFVNAMIVESPLIKGRKIWRALLVIPWALPQLIVLMMFRNLFDKDGLMNQALFMTHLMEPVTRFLHWIGLEGKPDVPIFWFQPIYNGALAKAVVLLTNLWYGAPYHMMMIIGVLSTIPKDLYEAADIDGATGYQRFRSITLPMVLAATVPSLIMTFSFNFNNFGSIFFLTGGGPVWDPAHTPDSLKIISSALPGQTDILISWIYKLSFTKDFEMYNVASAYSIIIFIMIGAYSVINMLKAKSFREEGGD
jgi:arabinogalactan oligomer/maltooligosaccharide transport system permease protein